MLEKSFIKVLLFVAIISFVTRTNGTTIISSFSTSGVSYDTPTPSTSNLASSTELPEGTASGIIATTTVSSTSIATDAPTTTSTPVINPAHTIQNVQASTVAPTTGTTTPPPTTKPTTPDPCLGAVMPNKESLDQCMEEKCAREYLEAQEFFIRCGKTGSETLTDNPMKMPNLGEMLADNIANTSVNDSVVIVTDQLAMGASVIDGSLYTNISRGMFYFPNISEEGVSDMLGNRIRNSILYPKKQLPLRSGYHAVGWSMSEVTTKLEVPKDEIEPYRDIAWRLPIGDMKIEKNKILIGKEKPHLMINSRIITFFIKPQPQEPLPEPLQISFERRTNDGVKNHRCYYWAASSSSESGYWSSIGCEVASNNDSHTTCSCNHMSAFVVLSEVHDAGNDDAKKAVRIVAILMCILAMAAVIGTIHLSRKLGCLDNDRVNIHVNLCVMLLIGYFLFIIGAIKNDIKELNDVLSFSLHFCQLSPFVWLSLEAIYLFNSIHPIFDLENTNTHKFYTSLGWALTAAFAGAAAGYDLPHNGKPFASEIVWIFINKPSVWYFLGPFLLLFLLNVFLRVGVVIRLIKYTPTSEGDKAPLRIKVNILTTLLLAGVIFAAWCMGIKAVNNTETKGYHYGFIVLYCLQAFLVLIIYGWQNEEMWTLHTKRKEDARKIEERKITFTYVP